MVVTPRKCPGRDLPSSLSLRPSTITTVLAPAEYISSVLGANSRSTPSRSNISRSRSKLRGYLLKSSVGPNCAGFTKMETTTTSLCCLARRTSERWPSCSAPMVGTRPMALPARCAARSATLVSAIDLTVCISGEACACAPTPARVPPAFPWANGRTHSQTGRCRPPHPP